MIKHRIRETGVPVTFIGEQRLYAGEWWQMAAVDGEVRVYPRSDLEEYNEPPDEILYDVAEERLRARGGKLTDDDMKRIVYVYNTYHKLIGPEV